MPCYDPPPSYERSDSHPLAHAFGIPTYRVEAHDGKRWSFGIRVNDNSRLPEFCSLSFAKHFLTRAEAFELRDEAARLCGGTLRVAKVH
jgi:hypothetical protein